MPTFDHAERTRRDALERVLASRLLACSARDLEQLDLVLSNLERARWGLPSPREYGPDYVPELAGAWWSGRCLAFVHVNAAGVRRMVTLQHCEATRWWTEFAR